MFYFVDSREPNAAPEHIAQSVGYAFAPSYPFVPGISVRYPLFFFFFLFLLLGMVGILSATGYWATLAVLTSCEQIKWCEHKYIGPWRKVRILWVSGYIFANLHARFRACWIFLAALSRNGKHGVAGHCLESLVWTRTGHLNVSQINKVIWGHHYIHPKCESKVFQYCKCLPWSQGWRVKSECGLDGALYEAQTEFLPERGVYMTTYDVFEYTNRHSAASTHQ
jgi:hypothetical protein